ncbi:MAG: Gfo/Idh/MocA family oxidoreductase [Phycisphaerae bacterium]|jgi:predicted dehydrogenase
MSSRDPLPVAVIGVGGFGGLVLQGLLASDKVKVVGVADRDGRAAEQAAAPAGLPSYSDNRSLLAETKPAAVYLSVPPPAAAELIAACADRGICVWKEPPLARNLDEGAAFVNLVEKAGLKLAVGTQRRFAPGYRRAWELRGEVGKIFLARGHYLFRWGAELGWRADKVTAGGGALLELAYPTIDLLLWMLGVPEEVYGLTARSTAEDAVPIHDTDDTAAAILRYGTDSMATVVTTRSSGPVSEELNLHGWSGSLTARSEWCTLRGPDGNVRDSTKEEIGPVDLFRRQAEAFAAAVTEGTSYYACSARENLLNLAVIEAIYLSDRTSQPENPLRLLTSRGWTVDDCLKHRPLEESISPPKKAAPTA